jgi:hypothetical protein
VRTESVPLFLNLGEEALGEPSLKGLASQALLSMSIFEGKPVDGWGAPVERNVRLTGGKA